MNRAQKRKVDKELKQKLTPEQFELIKSQVIDEKAKEINEKFVGNFISVFMPAMRENKVSEDRAMKIIENVLSRANERFNKGEVGEPRPNERYIAPEEFESKVADFFKTKGISNSVEISKELFNYIMGVDSE